MQTLRTQLNPVSKRDYGNLLNLYQNEFVRRYLGGTVSHTEFDQKFNEMLETELPEVYWVVNEVETGEFIGLVSITKYQDTVFYEVSYELTPRYWNQGYGVEVVNKVIDYAFCELGLEELYAETQKKNVASVRLLEKVGMKFQFELERYGEIQFVFSKKI